MLFAVKMQEKGLQPEDCKPWFRYGDGMLNSRDSPTFASAPYGGKARYCFCKSDCFVAPCSDSFTLPQIKTKAGALHLPLFLLRGWDLNHMISGL